MDRSALPLLALFVLSKSVSKEQSGHPNPPVSAAPGSLTFSSALSENPGASQRDACDVPCAFVCMFVGVGIEICEIVLANGKHKPFLCSEIFPSAIWMW